MKKRVITALLAVSMTGLLCMTSFAGVWRSDGNGWWWQNDNGSWPMNTWQWLDGDRNGVSECYYFDSHGYCLLNATTPDGYYVNGSGAWTKNGVVQTRTIDEKNRGTVSGGEQGEANSSAEKVKALDLVTAKTVTGGFDSFTGKHTVQGDVLSRGLIAGNGSKAEWFTGGKYTEFKTRLAISADNSYSSKTVMMIEVLDESLDVLDSMEMALRQAPEEFTVDVSEADYITIRVSRIEGDYGRVLFENPVFR